jgi:hypothetical protein
MRIFLQMMVLTVLIYGCSKSKEEFVKHLTNNDSKYWNLKSVIRKNGEKFVLPRKIVCIKFSANREFLNFHYRGENIYNPNQYSDVILPNKWKYIDENTILMNESRVKIKHLSEDTLIYVGDGEQFIFVKSLYNLDSFVIDRPMPNAIIY